MRCRLWLTLAGIFLSLIAALPVTAQGAKARSSINSALVAFDASPFPYTGDIPEQNVPFLQNDEAGAFHLAPRAGKLREATYADKRSLLAIPSGFDPNRAGAKLVLFFHGNLATLERVETLQRVPQQLAASHLDAVLVAPQMAKSALDSSAGHFWERGFFDTYLDEAARHLADRSHGAFDAAAIAGLPVVIVAYSGGYLADRLLAPLMPRAEPGVTASREWCSSTPCSRRRPSSPPGSDRRGARPSSSACTRRARTT